MEHPRRTRLVAGPARKEAPHLLARLGLGGGALRGVERLGAAETGHGRGQIGELLRLEREGPHTPEVQVSLHRRIPVVVVAIVVSVLIMLTCAGAGFLLLLFFVIGIVLLRRRGKKNVTAKEAVQAGAERVSQVFLRTKGGLQAVDDEDDKEDNRPIG